MTRRDIPNIITVFRILLIAPTVVALLQGRFLPALVLFGIAGLSDAIDGFLARRFGWFTPLGAMLDPIADKLLLVATFLTLGWGGYLPFWLVAVVLARDVLIVAGAWAFRRSFGHLEMEPTAISKFNTFLQIALILVVILSLGLAMLPAWMVDSLVYTVLASTLLSGANYVWIWGRRAVAEAREKR